MGVISPIVCMTACAIWLVCRGGPGRDLTVTRVAVKALNVRAMIPRVAPPGMVKIDIYPVVSTVAFVTLQTSCEMIARLPNCCSAVMATGAGTYDCIVIKVGRYPGYV